MGGWAGGGMILALMVVRPGGRIRMVFFFAVNRRKSGCGSERHGRFCVPFS